MTNFDFLKDLSEFQQLYAYCRDAENYQIFRPDISVVGARKALENWVKIVYLTNGWDIPQQPKLMELVSNEDFKDYIGDSQVIDNIHFIRRIGNQGAHGQFVHKRESLHALACLHSLVAEWLFMVGAIDSIPHFNKDLIPAEPTIRVVVQGGNETPSATAIQQYAQNSEGKRLHVSTPHELTEAETRRMFIDLMLREAGWDVLDTKGAILPGKACIEVHVDGMPNDSEEGYADYVLFSENQLPFAVIEAKRTSKDPRAGKHQAVLYADALERRYGLRPVIYYTNGFQTFVQDGLGYPDREVFSFHTLEDLRLIIQKRSRQNIKDLRVNEDIAGRYYQIEAIKNVCTHLNTKHRRGLIVMATGTGKTRVSIGLTELLIRNDWVKNILFLADRRSLVRQAYKNYEKLLNNESKTVLSENKEPNMEARIMFSTYQTMIRYIDADEKKFSVGRFDLIIIDEAHRSVFGKYGTIFDYFDSLLIGLTATPREDIDRSTYSLLQLEEGIPNYEYDLEKAIKDGNLVGYRAFMRSSKIMTEGAKYDELSASEKESLEKVWDFEKARKALDPKAKYSRDIESSEIYHYLFNIDTIDKVLDDLMTNGLRIHDGNILGKSIIFAYNHQHAQQIVDRFHERYPQLGEDYCILIDNQVNYGQDLIETFSVPRDEAQKHYQIVVSVDMMDTGIDVPDCLNLVFFKPVRSKIKFNQMIGRGTRLCPDVFGPGKDKKEFFIFDYCGNFEFFSENPQGAEPMKTVTLNERLFGLRLDLAVLLQDARFQTNEYTRKLCDELKDILHAQVDTLNTSNIAVRKQLERVVKYKKRENWQYVSEVEAQGLKANIAPIIFLDDSDYAAKQFDVLCLLEQLSLIDNTVKGNKPMEKIRTVAELLEKRASILQVQNALPTIREVQSVIFWEAVHSDALYGLQNLERIRVELRDLVQYILGEGNKTFEINIIDTISDKGETEPIIIRASYHRRVLEYLAENSDNPVILKIQRMEQLDATDIRALEEIFWNELGTKEEYKEAYEQQDRYTIWGGRIAAFIRSIVGLDRDVARRKYIDLIQGEDLTPEQDEFLSDILDYVCANGDISTQTMAEEPFSEFPWQPVFNNRFTALVNYVNTLHKVIVA